MERKPSPFLRRYRHDCPADGRNTQIPQEICPKCGQKGKFDGFFIGMVNRMGRQARLLGIPINGPSQTYLPRMARACETCRGQGIVCGEDFDYECPDCNETGGILIRSQAEMAKIRRWANARHARWVEEKNRPPAAHAAPPTLIFSRDVDEFTRGMMASIRYGRKYDQRNERIGEIVLPCDDHGWDIFMELVESWEGAGMGLAARQKLILLKDSLHRDAITLVSLNPPTERQRQGIKVHLGAIRKKYGLEAEQALWQAVSRLKPTPQGWVAVDAAFTPEEGQNLLAAMMQVAAITPKGGPSLPPAS